MAKQRYKIQTTYDGKRHLMKSLKNVYGVRDISSEKNRFGEFFVYFTCKDYQSYLAAKEIIGDTTKLEMV